MSKRYTKKQAKQKKLIMGSRKENPYKDFYIYTDETNARKIEFVNFLQDFGKRHEDVMFDLDDLRNSGNIERILRVLFPQGMISIAHYDVKQNIAGFMLYKDTQHLDTIEHIQDYLANTKGVHIIDNYGREISLQGFYNELRLFDDMSDKAQVGTKDNDLYGNVQFELADGDLQRKTRSYDFIKTEDSIKLRDDLITKVYLVSDKRSVQAGEDFIKEVSEKFPEFDTGLFNDISFNIYLFNFLFVDYRKVLLKMVDDVAFRPVIYEENANDTFNLMDIIINNDDLIIEKWDNDTLLEMNKKQVFDKFMDNAAVNNFGFEKLSEVDKDDKRLDEKRVTLDKHSTNIADYKEAAKYRSIFMMNAIRDENFDNLTDKQKEELSQTPNKYEFDIISQNQPVTDEEGRLMSADQGSQVHINED